MIANYCIIFNEVGKYYLKVESNIFWVSSPRGEGHESVRVALLATLNASGYAGPSRRNHCMFTAAQSDCNNGRLKPGSSCICTPEMHRFVAIEEK